MWICIYCYFLSRKSYFVSIFASAVFKLWIAVFSLSLSALCAVFDFRRHLLLISLIQFIFILDRLRVCVYGIALAMHKWLCTCCYVNKPKTITPYTLEQHAPPFHFNAHKYQKKEETKTWISHTERPRENENNTKIAGAKNWPNSEKNIRSREPLCSVNVHWVRPMDENEFAVFFRSSFFSLFLNTETIVLAHYIYMDGNRPEFLVEEARCDCMCVCAWKPTQTIH